MFFWTVIQGEALQAGGANSETCEAMIILPATAFNTLTIKEYTSPLYLQENSLSIR